MPYADQLGRCDYCGDSTPHPDELELMCDECADADERGELVAT
jgi:hypothetical protein